MPAKAPRRKFGASQKDRIFFACLPGAETAARIHVLAETLKREQGFAGTLILPEHLHVTLFHLGDWQVLPQEIVEIAKRAAAEVEDAFKPHVTLLRDPLRAKPLRVNPIVWTVRDFVLIHSLLGQTKHVHLGRWPLR
jgi:2'-5' RNA ligase